MLTPIKVSDLIERLAEHAAESQLTPFEMAEQVEKRCLEFALEMNCGNQVKTARGLGIHRNTLWIRMRKHGIPTRGQTAKHGRRGQ